MEWRPVLLIAALGCASVPTGTDLAPTPVPTPVNVTGRVTDTIAFVGVDLSSTGPSIGGHYDGLLKVYQYPVTISAATANTWSDWLYLYLNEAKDPIDGLVKERSEWLSRIYKHPLKDILNRFDANANKMVAPNCYGSGLSWLKTEALYDQVRSNASS